MTGQGADIIPGSLQETEKPRSKPSTKVITICGVRLPGKERLTNALLDRLTSRVHIIEADGLYIRWPGLA